MTISGHCLYCGDLRNDLQLIEAIYSNGKNPEDQAELAGLLIDMVGHSTDNPDTTYHSKATFCPGECAQCMRNIAMTILRDEPWDDTQS